MKLVYLANSPISSNLNHPKPNLVVFTKLYATKLISLQICQISVTLNFLHLQYISYIATLSYEIIDITDTITSQSYHTCNGSENIAVGQCSFECPTSTMTSETSTSLLTREIFIAIIMIFPYGTPVGRCSVSFIILKSIHISNNVS